MWFSIFLVLLSVSVLFRHDIYLGVGSGSTTVWARAAHSVNRMFSLLCLFVTFVVSHFGFEGGTLVLIATVPSHYFPFTF